MTLALLLPAAAFVLSLVGLAAVAVDPRHPRRAVLPAVSASTCVLASLGLLMAVAVRESIVTMLAAGLLLGAIPLVLLALARVLPTWSGPRSFPVWWWRVFYSGVIVGLGLFAFLLAALPGADAIGSASDRIDPIVAATVGLVSLLPQTACGRARFASGWGGAGAVAAAGLAALMASSGGMSLDLAAATGWVVGVSSLNVTRPCAAPPPVDSDSGIAAIDSWRIAATASIVGFGTVMAVALDWAIRRFG
jgi:hypothetical protein